MKSKWSKEDRQAFADNKLRAQTIPSRRNDGPEAEEWDDAPMCVAEFLYAVGPSLGWSNES